MIVRRALRGIREIGIRVIISSCRLEEPSSSLGFLALKDVVLKITVAEITDRKNLIGHIILNSAAASSMKLGESFVDGCGEITMTLNGFDIDIEPFAKHLESELDRMIEERAKQLLNEKCEDIKNVIYDLAEKMSMMAEDAIRTAK